jgi:hypothetical protein
MSVTKEQAIANITIAKLQSQIAWTVYVDWDAKYDEHVRAETKYETMREIYIQCGVLTWDDIQSMRKYVINAVE